MLCSCRTVQGRWLSDVNRCPLNGSYRCTKDCHRNKEKPGGWPAPETFPGKWTALCDLICQIQFYTHGLQTADAKMQCSEVLQNYGTCRPLSHIIPCPAGVPSRQWLHATELQEDLWGWSIQAANSDEARERLYNYADHWIMSIRLW